MFHSVGILGCQDWETASQVILRELLQGGGGGESGYIEVCNKGANNLNIKRLLLRKIR